MIFLNTKISAQNWYSVQAYCHFTSGCEWNTYCTEMC